MRKNINTLDYGIQIIIFIPILVLLFTKTTTELFAIVLRIAGGVLLLTSILNFCSYYKNIELINCKIK